MKRARLFIDNFFAYGLISVLNKIIPFFLLPIITRLLPNVADFGKFDMYNLIVNLGAGFAILGMYDAMFREFFEKTDESYKLKVTSTAYIIVGISSILITLSLIIFQKGFSQLFLGSVDEELIIMAGIGVWVSANLSMISTPTRLQNHRNIYILSGLLQTLGYYLLSIWFIDIGFGYMALIYSNTIMLIILYIFFFLLNRSYFSFAHFDKNVAYELIKIGLPIVPIFVIYWVLGSVDKIMLANMMGMSDVGVYSIGLKVASISQLIYVAFAGGWQYFAFSTMKDKDQVELTSKIFEYLGIISFVIFILIMFFIDEIFNLLFVDDYLKGVIVFPYLFLSPLLLMLIQTVGNQLLVIKKTYWGAICLLMAAITNVGFNFVLIPFYGIKGAALSTLLGYIVAVIMTVLIVFKMKLIYISLRFLISSLFIAGLVFLLFITNGKVNYIVFSVVLFSIIYLYRREMVFIGQKCKKIKKGWLFD